MTSTYTFIISIVIIEYNGQQHYLKNHNFGNKKHKLVDIQTRDKIKLNYCLNNNISLLIIPYYENIENSLVNFFRTYKLKTTT